MPSRAPLALSALTLALLPPANRAWTRAALAQSTPPIDGGVRAEHGLRAPPAWRPAPAATVVAWPDRVCTAARGALRVENDCGCNDRLLCAVTSVGASAIELEVRTDPSATPFCRDCFPMVPASCALPRLVPARRYEVRIHGAPAFAFVADASGAPPAATCWVP